MEPRESPIRPSQRITRIAGIDKGSEGVDALLHKQRFDKGRIIRELTLVESRNGAIGKNMTETERQILQTLIELEEKVRSMPSSNPKPNLVLLFSRIDELSRQLPRNTPPTLLHYLQKKSYEKARLFLQGRDAENAEGNCGHV
jgi:hypothetical protein